MTHHSLSLMTERSRSSCHRASSDDRFGETLHLFEMRAALQQQEINARGFEFRDAIGDLLGRTD